MRVVSLLENTAAMPGIGVEHGLSLYVEWRGVKLLFDMGQSGLFAQNAEALGVDLSAVDAAVLSHGHYDHGGGLSTFLALNDHAPVYVHADAFLPHYNGTEKYIGLDPTLRDHPRLVFTRQTLSIFEGATLHAGGDFSRLRGSEASGLTERVGNRFVPEDFRHEQYLLLEENGRRVLLSGCSHRGILDIARQFLPDVLIGGFHFSKRPLNGELREAAESLGSLPITYYTCHCTGVAQFEFMRRYMPRLFYLAGGDSVEL
jgi:7,8-dihydropterin-6-yl-methyl-4-(beta-D-ribofuranosyl)aminobenzene 5'-phosphate synthase